MSSAARALAEKLLSRPSMPPLSPNGPYDPGLTKEINQLPDPVPLRAALHLMNDDISNAHNLAQSKEGDIVADYVHQQLHRREGDYWNSKWWLGTIDRSSGFIPAFKSIHGSVSKGKAFVDACEKAGNGGNEELKVTQWAEMKATLEYALQNS